LTGPHPAADNLLILVGGKRVVRTYTFLSQIVPSGDTALERDYTAYRALASKIRRVVDIRNGLYILKYTGRRAGEVSRLDFLEGNSNLGDAVRLTAAHDR
jgi:hypothetical protein